MTIAVITMTFDPATHDVSTTTVRSAAPIVILNPMAAYGRTRRLRALIERALVGRDAELQQTTAPGDGERLAYAAAQAGRDVVVVGGDGTIAEAAAGIHRATRDAAHGLSGAPQVTLGIVPAGTGNDYAYGALHLPHLPLQALEVALTGPRRQVDLGEVNGYIFVNYVGVGIDANVAHRAERLKRMPLMRGKTLYWAASLTELLLHYDRCPRVTVCADGTAASERRPVALATASLGPTYGGGFRINPDADLADGALDLCTIWKPPLRRALGLLPLIERGAHIGAAEVTIARVRSVVLEAEAPVYAHHDGELLTTARLDIRILPGALWVRVAAPSEDAH